ncbi:MAG TPA: Crp/Fnr family transcriptional regulator [Methylomusa anaerophila]|uniref:Crp/Fnr family transcriptional regulator n=1 Tax=Methylomusa anaerophila TaxID=1930071 RepID=UPI0018D53FA0|nr:Crp/Fnr family transcriptional regulator [Methylomusa anaerophila]HML87562.1 Crp/Fnr family transcriptional regulator [Methylomusa anaerophila]
MDKKRYLCLHDIPLFSGLSMEFFRQICLATDKQHLTKGQSLFRQGEVSNRIYIIKEGYFKLLRITPDGDETILQFVGPGEIIGETALFRADKAQLATAISVGEAKVCSIDHNTFEKIIKNQPNLAWELIRNLGDRLYGVWEQLSETNSQTTQEKVLSLMIRMANEHGESCHEGVRITIPLTQQEIASLVGASRVMVVQAIKELTMQNYLCRENRYYILKNKCF